MILGDEQMSHIIMKLTIVLTISETKPGYTVTKVG